MTPLGALVLFIAACAMALCVGLLVSESKKIIQDVKFALEVRRLQKQYRREIEE